MQAHYAGAVPLDLPKSEQDPITQQLAMIDASLDATTATFSTLANNLHDAMDLPSNCDRLYEVASDRNRRS